MMEWLWKFLGLEELVGRILAQGERIMSAISELAAAQDAAFGRMNTALEGIRADLQFLKDHQGELSPEDAATVDRLKANADAMAAAMESLDGEN
jgi:hypothetical protein